MGSRPAHACMSLQEGGQPAHPVREEEATLAVLCGVAGTSEWGAAARRFFRADEDLVAIFPVLSSTVTGLSCGAAAVLAMLQWKTGCSFLPKVGRAHRRLPRPGIIRKATD